MTRDPRWALAAAVYVTPKLVWLTDETRAMSLVGVAYWGTLSLLPLATAAISVRPRQRLDL